MTIMSKEALKFMQSISHAVLEIENSNKELFIKEVVIPVWLARDLRESLNNTEYFELKEPNQRTLFGYHTITDSSLVNSFTVVVANSFIVE